MKSTDILLLIYQNISLV